LSTAWTADTETTTELALALLASQFPQLDAHEIEVLGVGWDNTAYLVNNRWVFRFPRRKVAANLLINEGRILPLLQPHLTVPIPLPIYLGKPQAEYPYPFVGYVHLPGATACSVTLSDSERNSNAALLGGFLAALHCIPVDAETAAWAPGDEIRRTDMQMRLLQLQERLNTLSSRLQNIGLDGVQIAAVAASLAQTPHSIEAPCWVHGDLYSRHLLLEAPKNQLCGVIDWGDVHIGDHALDLSIALSFLPPAARDEFREAYGKIDANTWSRARFRAINYGAILVLYGMDVGDEELVTVGQSALKNAMTEN